MRTKRNEGEGLQKLLGFRGLSIISGQIITEISGNNIVCQLGLNMHVCVVEKKDESMPTDWLRNSFKISSYHRHRT